MELQSRTSGAAKLLESQELHQWGSKASGAMKRGERGVAKPKLREPQELHRWSCKTLGAAKRGERGAVKPPELGSGATEATKPMGVVNVQDQQD